MNLHRKKVIKNKDMSEKNNNKNDDTKQQSAEKVSVDKTEKIKSEYAETRKERIIILLKKSVLAAVGLMCFGAGDYLTIQANIGVAPWDTLNLGLSQTLGILYGTASIGVSLTLIIIDLLLKEHIGIGTILDAIVVGKTVDLLNWLDIVPKQENIWLSIPMMIVGFFIMGLSQVMYMKAGLGCGPRDSFMLALGKRLDRIPIGAVNILILIVVLFAGWRLGGPIGIGTVLAAFGIGMMMQLAFNITKFEPKSVVHENILQSIKKISK